MERNGDAAIYGSRPWRIFGEGPTAVPTGVMNEGEVKPFTAEDVRFTTRDGALHAILLAWPNAPVTIAALGRRAMPAVRIERVRLIGGGPFAVDHDAVGRQLLQPSAGAGGRVPR